MNKNHGRERITFKNERVISILEEAKKSRSMTRFVEDAVLFYLDNFAKRDQYVTREEVKDILIEYLAIIIALSGKVNIQEQKNNLTDIPQDLQREIDEILELGEN